MPVWGAMRVMADSAILNYRSMLEDLGPPDILMALETLVILDGKRSLLAVMRIMATGAGKASFLYRVVRGHIHASCNILVAIHAEGRAFVGFPHADFDFLNFGGMQAMTITALESGFFVFRKGPAHALVVVAFMAGQAIIGCGEFDSTLPTFDSMLGTRGMTGKAVAVINIDFVCFIRHVTGFAHLVASRC